MIRAILSSRKCPPIQSPQPKLQSDNGKKKRKSLPAAYVQKL